MGATNQWRAITDEGRRSLVATFDGQIETGRDPGTSTRYPGKCISTICHRASPGAARSEEGAGAESDRSAGAERLSTSGGGFGEPGRNERPPVLCAPAQAVIRSP